MTNSKRVLFITVLVVAMILVIGNLAGPVNAHNLGSVPQIVTSTPTVQADSQNMLDAAVPEEIKSIIQSYFESRYYAFSSFQLDGFRNLVSNMPEAAAFLKAESGKLNIELKRNKDYHLRWTEHEYFLNYTDIAIDNNEQTVIVNVVEGFDVIYEISREFN